MGRTRRIDDSSRGRFFVNLARNSCGRSTVAGVEVVTPPRDWPLAEPAWLVVHGGEERQVMGGRKLTSPNGVLSLSLSLVSSFVQLLSKQEVRCGQN